MRDRKFEPRDDAHKAFTIWGQKSDALTGARIGIESLQLPACNSR